MSKQTKTREDWLATARTLAEALPYMRKFSKQIFVIKFGGAAMGEDKLTNSFARDVMLLKQSLLSFFFKGSVKPRYLFDNGTIIANRCK